MALGQNDTVFCVAPFMNRPFLDLLKPVKAAGFSALSITPAHLEGVQAAGVSPAELRLRLSDLGLRIAQFECIANWLPEHAQGPQTNADYADMLLGMTAERLMPMAEAVGASSIAAAELFKVEIEIETAAEALASLCGRAANHNLSVDIEFVPAGGIRDIATTGEIIRRSGCSNAGITLDTLHFFRGGSTLAQLRELPPQFIGLVQLADGTADAPEDIELEMVSARLLPGEGGLNIQGIVDTLDAMGVSAPIGVEVFSDAVNSEPLEVTAHHWMAAMRAVTGRAKA